MQQQRQKALSLGEMFEIFSFFKTFFCATNIKYKISKITEQKP
jgi:hypothetical protein